MTIHDELGNTVPAPAQKHYTPNVVIEDPRKRKIITTIIGISGLILGTAISIDGASPELNFSAYTTPASAALLFIAGAFGLTVTLPNTPTK